MTEREQTEERDWAADKRDFVADARDEIAGRREVIADARDDSADERERLADFRETALDERERRLKRGAAGSHTPDRHRSDEDDAAATAGRAAPSQRKAAGEQRALRRTERDLATEAATQAEKQRKTSTPTTGLAMAFAEIARYLFEAENFDDVLTRIVETAVDCISGCDMSSITTRDQHGTFRTPVATHEAAQAADDAQYEARQGPCIDALEATLVRVDALPDARWPELASQPVDHGVQSVVSYRLAMPEAADEAAGGSLNTYATTRVAFDDEAVEIGLILAAHASVAVGAIGQRDAAEDLRSHLLQAIQSRDVIGQAKGILMERLRIPAGEAFDILRRSSQHLNVKLRDIAERLNETGELNVSPDSFVSPASRFNSR